MLATDPERDLPPTLDGVGVGARASSAYILISRSSTSLSSAMGIGDEPRVTPGEEGIKPGDDGRSPGDEGGERPHFGYKSGGARRPEEKNAEYAVVMVEVELLAMKNGVNEARRRSVSN